MMSRPESKFIFPYSTDEEESQKEKGARTFDGHRSRQSGTLNLELADDFLRVRSRTEFLLKPLAAEDVVVQSMPDASPVKWHLAHATWFFEAFILKSHFNNYQVFDPNFNYLFNSYYESVGPRQP